MRGVVVKSTKLAYTHSLRLLDSRTHYGGKGGNKGGDFPRH